MKVAFSVLLILILFVLRLQFLPKINIRDGQQVRVTGVLREEPQVSGNWQSFKIGQFKVQTTKWPEFHYGDVLEITGKIQTEPLISFNFPLKFSNFPLKSFNFPLKFSLNRYRLLEPTISVAPPETGSGNVQGFAILLKTRLLDVYKKIFPGVFDGIVGGIVLGDKSLLPKDFWDKLKATGTLHLMVASGMNIALFSGSLLSLICSIFVRKISLVILICLIWFYTLMAGLQPPIIRAAVMASFVYLGQLLGRQTETKRVFWLTGLFLIFLNPELIFDIGFQLSFLATGGLIYVQPLLENKGEVLVPMKAGIPEAGNFQFLIFNFKSIFKFSIFKKIVNSENFTSSLAAQIATLPILLLNFGMLNLISPLINLLILWTVPIILQFGILLGILGLLGGIGEFSAKILSYFLYPLLLYLEQVIEITAKWTIFQISLPKISVVFVILYYIGVWLWVRNIKNM